VFVGGALLLVLTVSAISANLVIPAIVRGSISVLMFVAGIALRRYKKTITEYEEFLDPLKRDSARSHSLGAGGLADLIFSADSFSLEMLVSESNGKTSYSPRVNLTKHGRRLSLEFETRCGRGLSLEQAVDHFGKLNRDIGDALQEQQQIYNALDAAYNPTRYSVPIQ
jgi:hypothetical protein